MYKILIVEDDMVIAGSLQKFLNGWGFLAEAVTEFDRVLETFLKLEPHLVLLDISLPFYNGYHWCRESRQVSKAPIIFLSSADDNMNIVMAMNMGADDFIAKPFDRNVLVAKVQALLRRAYSFSGSVNILEHGGAILNLGDGTLWHQDRKTELTRNELKILEFLMETKGKVLSREAIMKRLWEDESFIDDNTLTVNVTRLRKKLDGLGLHNYIVTKKGLGYLVEG